MRKRLIRALPAAILLLLLTTMALADGTVLEVTLPDVLPAAGEEFSVTVDLSGNPGFSALQFTLAYDKSRVECLDISNGTLLSGTMSASNPSAPDGAIVAAASTSEKTGNGNLVTFTFRAKTDLTAWNMSMKDVLVCDSDAADIAVVVTGVQLGGDETEAGPEAQEEIQQGSADSEPQEDSSTKKEDDDSSLEENTTGLDKREQSQEDESEERQTEDAPESEAEREESSLPENIQLPEELAQPAQTQALSIAPASTVSFTDLAGHWAEPYVIQAAALGLFNGYSDGRFGPDDNVTRAQFITVLWRMSGSPAPQTLLTPFTDLEGQSTEFKTAIAWGYENGCINGMSTTTFEPNGSITREQAMKILFWYSGGLVGMEALFADIYDDAFIDSGAISDWAKAPMRWGIYYCMITGTTSTTLSPQGTATRAQLAKILVNYLSIFGTQGGTEP